MINQNGVTYSYGLCPAMFSSNLSIYHDLSYWHLEPRCKGERSRHYLWTLIVSRKSSL